LPSMLPAPVDTLHAMLSRPDRADPDIVMLCCLEVAAWARGAGLRHTAVAFAQAGAEAAPESGDAAVFTGVCAREAGQLARAETWFRRAVPVARREQNWTAHASALVELGVVCERRGELLRAERFYRRAMRVARGHGDAAEEMRAAHGLFRLARQKGDDAGAAQFALSAELALDADEAGAADLLLDLARFWTDVGEGGRASEALRRLVPAVLTMEPAGQLATFALTARARAEPGHPQAGAVAWQAAWALLGNSELPDAVRYAAAIDLAHAARTTGDPRAFGAARRAVLGLAPPAERPAVAERLDELWSDEEIHRVDRAS
ncbi:tetratricopeptide repeat protein, partial [Longimicrobium sp.]|uniref:tetratricopeptide repeat protein n=1 Tax=Longimicrobium sp. TaxID=2029185 RepID=UPI002E341734